jgi:hypothetical protein
MKQVLSPKTIQLGWRPTQVGDLEACLPLIHDRFLYQTKAARKNLLALWKHLLETGSGVSAVVEDQSRPKEHRPVGFGLSLFATDKFAREAHSTLPPFLSLQAVEKWLAHEPFFLKAEEILKAQTQRGLVSVVLNYGLNEKEYAPVDQAAIRTRIRDSFMELHRGYRIREILQETFDAESQKRLAQMGLGVVRDYREFPRNTQARGMTGNLPLLMGSNFEQSLKREGTLAAKVFHGHSNPRLGFRPVEREILQAALKGETDEGTARLLGVSLAAVKKRWQGLFNRVAAVDPDLLADGSNEKPTPGSP